jgi:DNA-binding MarR family transcriptional regulator
MASKRAASDNPPNGPQAKSRRGRSEVLWRVERAGFLLKNSTATTAAAFGLSFSEHTTLASLVSEHDPDAGLTQSQLVDMTGSSPSAMTSRIDRLEARGLVQRTPDPRDRRATVVRLTPAGAELVWSALEAVDDAQRGLLSAFSEEELGQFAGYLRRFIASLETSERYK